MTGLNDYLDAPLGKMLPSSTTGNTPWAVAYQAEITDIIRRYSAKRPRSLQVHLGPSELGVECDRQVVGKLLGVPVTNHVTDPWPSFMGTAGHGEMEKVMEWDNAERYPSAPRWHTERRVIPHPDHAGTADLYDVQGVLGDYKFLGDASMDKVKSPAGPPRKYQAQLGMYGLGYIREGFRVDRVALIALPRTGSTLAGTFVWEKPFVELLPLLEEVWTDTARRKAMAQGIVQGQGVPGAMTLADVPMAPDSQECYFCPFYRPYAQEGVGCPGPQS